jgi:exopolysaccharide production protein ExoY
MFSRHRFNPDLPSPLTSRVALREGAFAGVRGDIVPERSHLPRLHPANADSGPIGGTTKRAMDIAICLVAIALLAPFMLLIAVLIRVTMGGPAIFAQQRVGRGGRLFTCYKFRTMVTDADEVLRRHLAANPRAAQEWRETCKLRDDPRVSAFGNILRKASLDELPQIFNVLRGDMSAVGPRPVVPGELANYGSHWRECFAARPGLTGLWQVSGRNSLSYPARVALDRAYARKWSIRLDLAILIRTVPALLSFHETA